MSAELLRDFCDEVPAPIGVEVVPTEVTRCRRREVHRTGDFGGIPQAGIRLSWAGCTGGAIRIGLS